MNLNEIFNKFTKSKKKEEDLEYVKILLNNLNFGFFQRRRILKELKEKKGDQYQNKKNEVIVKMQSRLEEMVSRRNFLKTAGKGIAVAGTINLFPGLAKKVFGGESRLNIPELSKNYKEKIKKTNKCILMTYATRNDWMSSEEIQSFDLFGKELLNLRDKGMLPSDLVLFKLDTAKLSKNELYPLYYDLDKNYLVPSFILYIKGMPVVKIRGSRNTEKKIKEAIKEIKTHLQ